MTAPSWITPSGNIGTIAEGLPFNFSLNFTGSPIIIDNLIAGALPQGLTLNSLGVISGTPVLEPQTTDYDFAIRLSNTHGFADRTFSLEVLNDTPNWGDPSNLGSYPPAAYFEYNFFVNDPGGVSQVFEKISGTLPPGLQLNSFGKLYGIVGDVAVSTLYTFTIRAILNSNQFIDKTFTFTVDPAAIAPPVWLTPEGLLGDIEQSIFGSFQVLAESPEHTAITYSAVGLPANITIDPATGIISGILVSNLSALYTFSVTATSGVSSTARVFSLNANKTTVYVINWVTQQGSIGDIKEGDKSLLGVTATSVSPWIRYEIVSGSLPLGLSMDINTGNIWGLAQEQENIDTVFNFEVRAYNENTEIFGNFSLTLINAYNPGATRVYATLYGHDKLVFMDLFSTPEIMIGNVFQDGDPQYGLVNKPKILLVENLDNPGPDTIFSTLSGVRRTYLNFGKVLVGKAVIVNEVVYEVLYRKIYDDEAGAAQQYVAVAENTSHVPVNIATVKPGSLTNIRNRLLVLGSSGDADNLPLWMQSEQTIGDPTTIPGWQPVLEFGYVKPGLGQGIADKINSNDIQLKKLYNNRIRIDRFVMEAAADNTFAPQFILFDNQF